MDQLGCCSTLYYVRKQGTWGCTSLFVSYLRIFCFHPKKQESLLSSENKKVWSWAAVLIFEVGLEN
jgi:hypothetical protein